MTGSKARQALSKVLGGTPWQITFLHSPEAHQQQAGAPEVQPGALGEGDEARRLTPQSISQTPRSFHTLDTSGKKCERRSSTVQGSLLRFAQQQITLLVAFEPIVETKG